MSGKYIEVEKVKSAIGQNYNKVRILKALGLKKIGSIKIHKNNNCIRGMVNKVIHLVKYNVKD